MMSYELEASQEENIMNPCQLEQVARQRHAEVCRSAESGRMHAIDRSRTGLRHRTGRAMAAIGLRSGSTSGAV
jgi:hypothetical protein